MSRIFLSYSRSNKDVVKNLEEDFEALGHTVWFDNQISGGEEWWNEILDEIRKCDLLAIVLNDSNISSACKSEYTYAMEVGKPVLPILISEDISPNLLPSELSNIQFVKYLKMDRQSAFQLSKALSNIPPADKLPEPLPKPPVVPRSYLTNLAKDVDSDESMDLDEQSALIIKIKSGLNDPKTRNDSMKLLQKLRKRRDLYSIISDEIDQLFEDRNTNISEDYDRRPEYRKTEPQQPEYRQAEYKDTMTQHSIIHNSETYEKWPKTIYTIVIISSLVLPIIGLLTGIYGLFAKKNKKQSYTLIIFSIIWAGILNIIWEGMYSL